MLKKRIQFFEWQDLPWFPHLIREGITDYLAFTLKTFGFYNPVVPVLAEVLAKSHKSTIVDLCSGSGGIMPELQEEFKNLKKNPPQIILTDRFPNETSISKFKASKTISYLPDSIDALDVDNNLNGLRTLFTSFHHFNNSSAQRILKNAVESREPIFIAEFTKRNLWTFLMCLPVPLFMPFLMPFVRPIKASNLIFTYIFPLIPLFTWWDILVTVLRTRDTQELSELTSELQEFSWKVGEIKTSFFFTLIYLYGLPRTTNQ